MSTVAFNTAAFSPAAVDAAPRTRLHITRRGRAVLTSLTALPLVVAAFLFALNGGVAAAGGSSTGQTFEYVTVEAGQSLWQLAESLAPAADPRDVIADIVSLNQLADTSIEPGQRLAIPAQY